MGLDIIVADSSGNLERSVRLFVDDYDKIMVSVEKENEFEILKSVLKSYYGDYDIYSNDVIKLKNEVCRLKNLIQVETSITLSIFIDDFLRVLDYAIENNRALKFIGD